MIYSLLLMLMTSISLTSTETADNVANLCPPERKTLRCSGSDVIVIVSARYDNQRACPRFMENGDCVVDDPMGFLTIRCFKKNLCSISNEDFENARNQPCEGAAIKPLVVKYNCVPEHTITEMCISDNMINGRIMETGFVTSPNYPLPYEADQSCSQQIMASQGQVIRISLLDLQLEDHPHPELDICFDQLVLMQRDSDEVHSKTYCQSGPRSLDNINTRLNFNLTRNEYIEASFESTSSGHNRGFLFKYEVIGCAISGIPKAPVHGRVQRVILNDMAIYSCDPGFAFDAPEDATIYCQGNAWQGTPVHCIPDSRNPSSSSSSNESPPSSTASATTLSSSASSSSIATTKPTIPTPSTTTRSSSATTVPHFSKRSTTAISTITPSTTRTTTATTTTTQRQSSTTTRSLIILASIFPSLLPTITKTTIQSTASPSTTNTVSRLPIEVPSSPSSVRTMPNTVTSSSSGSSSTNQMPSTSLSPILATDNSGNPFVPEKPGSLPARTSIGIGIGVGGALAILAILLAILFFVKCRQSRRHKTQYTKQALDTLRPSAHACGSIPSMYAGISLDYSKNRPVAELGYVNDSFTPRSSGYSVDSAMYEAHRKSDSADSSPSSGSARDSFQDDIFDSGTFLLAHEAAISYIDSSNRTELMTIHEEIDSESYLSRGSSVSRATAEAGVAVPPGQFRHMMRPTSLQDTKNAKQKSKKRKVDYPLFKVDSTGNLENYLESRRVSV